MILSSLLLQAAATVISPEARERYQPFRQCLIEQARSLAVGDQGSAAILEQARSNCLAANLSSGSAALFAEMEVGATQEQAVERVAHLREEVEQEALATVAARNSNGAPAAEGARLPNLRRAVPLGSVNIPDEIAPAVAPYLQCLISSSGVEIRSPGGTPQPPTVPAGTDCTPRRVEAAQRADRMLRNQGRGTRAERTAYVEAVLANVDRFVSDMPNPGTLFSDPAGKPIDQSADEPHAPN